MSLKCSLLFLCLPIILLNSQENPLSLGVLVSCFVHFFLLREDFHLFVANTKINVPLQEDDLAQAVEFSQCSQLRSSAQGAAARVTGSEDGAMEPVGSQSSSKASDQACYSQKKVSFMRSEDAQFCLIRPARVQWLCATWIATGTCG